MSAENAKVESSNGRKGFIQKGLWGFIILAFAFLLGYLAGYVPQSAKLEELNTTIMDLNSTIQQKEGKIQHLEGRIQQKDFHLELAALRDEWMMIHLEILKNNFGNALSLTTSFFNRLQQGIQNAEDPNLKSQLMEISRQRDQVTALLAKADPTVRELVEQMLLQLHEVTKMKES